MTKLKGKARAKASKKLKNKSKNNHFLYIKKLLSLIRKWDDPVLAEKCQEVVDIENHGEAIKEIISQMKKVLYATKDGVGIAANQIGFALSIIAIRPNVKVDDITIMINPKIVEHSENKRLGREMCLSYPGISGIVGRYVWVEVKYLDENNKENIVKYKEGDFLGTIIQHELSHLTFGHCEIYDWWKNPEKKRLEIQQRLEKKEESEEETSGYQYEESEDRKREREEEEKEAASEGIKEI
jgi:peptide deformylase